MTTTEPGIALGTEYGPTAFTAGDLYAYNGIPGQTRARPFSAYTSPLTLDTIVRIDAVSFTGKVHLTAGRRLTGYGEPTDDIQWTSGHHEVSLTDAHHMIAAGIWTPIKTED